MFIVDHRAIYSELSEKIARVLLRMQCPYAVEPHQLQGLDYPALEPLVRWLVQKVAETRSLYGDWNRQHAAFLYDRSRKLQASRDTAFHEQQQPSQEILVRAARKKVYPCLTAPLAKPAEATP